MKLEYEIFISGVDGQTSFSTKRTNAAEVLDFLSQYDHEGSNINLRVWITDDEDIYKFLKVMENYEIQKSPG